MLIHRSQVMEGPERVSLRKLVNPTKKQVEFWHSLDNHKFTLFGGARGGAKSYILRWTPIRFLLMWAAQGFENVRTGIFCETFPTLKNRQMNRAIRGRVEERYPLWLGTWNLQDHEFRLHPEYGGGIVGFRNLDDTGKYLSDEYALILIDELTRNTVETFNQLRGSLRWPGIEHTPFGSSSNPGSIGHLWVKDVFVDRAFELDETKNLVAVNPKTGRSPMKREDFNYVISRVRDNPYNAESYVQMLEGLPDKLRAAYLDGNWDVYEGQAFDEWNAAVHVTPFNTIAHLKHWRWVAGLDWGYRKGVIYLGAIGPEGDIELVHEIVFSRIHAYDAAIAFHARWSKLGMHPEIIIADEQMWQDASQHAPNTPTLASEFHRGLIEAYGAREDDGWAAAPRLVKGAHGPGSRKVKYNLMHKYLKYREDKNGKVQPWGRPLLRVQPRCKYFVRTIPTLPVDPDRPEDDVDTTHKDDHGYDAGCFILMAQIQPPESESDKTKPDQHPGFDKATKRRRRPKPAEEGLEIISEREGYQMPGYEMPGQLEEVTE